MSLELENSIAAVVAFTLYDFFFIFSHCANRIVVIMQGEKREVLNCFMELNDYGD